MSDQKKRIPDFVPHSTWGPFLPEEFQLRPEPSWHAASNRGDFPPFVRTVGERSKAHWRASDITAWFKLKFSKVYPEAVAALLAAGFPEPIEQVTYLQSRRQRTLANKKKRKVKQ